MTGIQVPVRQRSEEWLAYRRTAVTATDIPILLGLSPWSCEADLADQKRGLAVVEENVRMRIGSALEDLIAEEYTAHTGRRLRRYRQMIRHPEIAWAAASPDAVVVGERRLVEMKWTTSRTRFADGLPKDIEAQVAWQLGVTGYPVADVAVLTADGLMEPFTVEADPQVFADLLDVAADFRRRLAENGPFARDAARVRRDHPADDGTEIAADAEVAEAVRALLDTRTARKRMEETEERLVAAIQARMADAAVCTGPGWRITWKRSKDRTETDWKALGTELMASIPETDRAAIVGKHAVVRPGFRPFRVTTDKETE